MLIVVLTTVLAFSALYAPQPLLPVIVEQFGVSPTTAALLTTVCFIPLSLAPLLYGLVLEAFSPRRMLRWAVLLLALSEGLFFLAPTFSSLLLVRVLQGLLLPAIFTALMTYVSVSAGTATVKRSMALYVASTIMGGFLGRAGSGLIAAFFGWRSSFLVLGVSLLAVFFLLGRLKETEARQSARPSVTMLLEVLSGKGFLQLYMLIFFMFFGFAAVMNFLPFRLTELSSVADEMRIGFMYTGYVMGVVTALSAVRIATLVGGEKRSLLIGITIFALAIGVLSVPSVPVIFAGMFVFCGAMFLIHATASGLLNSMGGQRRGVVNGLYVCCYYAGGMAGSYLPGFAYHGFGWSGLSCTLLIATALALAVCLFLPGRRT